MSAPSPPTIVIDGFITEVTPDMLKLEDDGSTLDLPSERSYELARTAVIRCLKTVRVPQDELRADFYPNADTAAYPGQPPLMHFGFALSQDELLSCVKRLNIAPQVALGAENLERTPLYTLMMCKKLEAHLKNKTGVDIAICKCLTPPDSGLDFVVSLYTNYSKGMDGWSAVETTRQLHEDRVRAVLVDAEDAKIELNFRIANGRLRWYWDARRCGFRYSAPWDEFNVWPSAEIPKWRQGFRVDEKVTQSS